MTDGLFARLKAANADEWAAYTRHEFVEAMGEGSLKVRAFKHYLVQDFLFLVHFARAYGLAVYKADTLDDMRAAARSLSAILDVEMDLHVRLCAEWGLSPNRLEQAPEDTATLAYTRFVLERGMAGDLLDLHVALSPCVIGYAEIGNALAPQATKDNPYKVWIDEYAGAAYQDVAASARETIDRLGGERGAEARFEGLSRTFAQATRLEAAFWQQGLDAA
jgi:thiaminase/transcriptional activator TenA